MPTCVVLESQTRCSTKHQCPEEGSCRQYYCYAGSAKFSKTFEHCWIWMFLQAWGCSGSTDSIRTLDGNTFM